MQKTVILDDFQCIFENSTIETRNKFGYINYSEILRQGLLGENLSISKLSQNPLKAKICSEIGIFTG